MQIELNRKKQYFCWTKQFQVFDRRDARKATLTRSSGLVCRAAAVSYRCYCWCCCSAAALPLLRVQHPYAYRCFFRTTFFSENEERR